MPPPPASPLARWMRKDALLQTKVARRVLVLFVLSAVVPVALLGAVTYRSVASALRREAVQRIEATSRQIGLQLYQDLDRLALTLEAAAHSPGPHAGTFGQFDAAVFVGSGGRREVLRGAPPRLPALTPAQREQIRRGGAALVLGDGLQAPLLLSVAGRVGRDTGVVWAQLPASFVAQIAEGIGEAVPGSRVCILAAGGRPVDCALDAATLRAGGFTMSAQASPAGSFEWSQGGQVYVAGFWSLFLDFRFAAPDWRIIYSEPRAAVLLPLTRFSHTFGLAGLLALLVVGLLSNVQIRRTLGPLRALHDGTERLARREFDRPVEIHSRDEFEDVARAFNGMADRLKQEFLEAENLTRALQATSGELQQREAQLRAVLESAAEGIIVVNVEGRIESFNAMAERLLGYGPQEAQGRPLEDMFAVPLGEGMLGEGSQVGSSTLQLAARRRDGSAFPAEVTVSRASAGGREFRTVFVRDISERKRSEEERDRLEAELRQAQKMETIGTLAGGIAHDFNNILTPIIGHVELLLAEAPHDSPARPSLDEVRRAAERAKDLVRQILTFSRRRETEFALVQLGPLVKEALKFLRASLPSTIEIRSHIAAELPPVMGDATQLHQVLMNLCTNASHAMRASGGVLEVRLETKLVEASFAAIHPRLGAGPVVQLVVKDTGHGMDEATLERIFEPFFTTKGPGEGTGLGLSIVHGIVTNHGGVITLTSALGQGTRFEIYLPAAPAETPVEREQPQRETQRGRGNILVVDDDDMIARLTSRILSRVGYRVTSTTSPAEALALVAHDAARFDLVITDQTMPGMTGVRLARELHALRPTLPIILMSGYSQIEKQEDAHRLGVAELLLKPLEIEGLAAAVARVLGAARAATKAALSGKEA